MASSGLTQGGSGVQKAVKFTITGNGSASVFIFPHNLGAGDFKTELISQTPYFEQNKGTIYVGRNNNIAQNNSSIQPNFRVDFPAPPINGAIYFLYVWKIKEKKVAAIAGYGGLDFDGLDDIPLE